MVLFMTALWVVFTQDSLVDLVGDVEALGICEVLQQETVDPKTFLTVLGSFQGKPNLFSA